jgi:hypothetical protein
MLPLSTHLFSHWSIPLMTGGCGYGQVPVPGACAAGGGEGGEPGPRPHHLGRHASHHQQVRHHVSLLNGDGWLYWWDG